MPEDPGMGQHQDPAVGVSHAVGRQIGIEAGTDGGGPAAEVVAGVEAGEGPERAGQRGQGVEVDEPEVGAPAQRVVHRLHTRVGDLAGVQRGYRW